MLHIWIKVWMNQIYSWLTLQLFLFKCSDDFTDSCNFQIRILIALPQQDNMYIIFIYLMIIFTFVSLLILYSSCGTEIVNSLTLLVHRSVWLRHINLLLRFHFFQHFVSSPQGIRRSDMVMRVIRSLCEEHSCVLRCSISKSERLKTDA